MIPSRDSGSETAAPGKDNGIVRRMGRLRLRHVFALLPLLMPAAMPARAAGEVTGIWLGHDRDGHVEIRRCGQFLCGFIISIIDTSLPPNPRDIYNEKKEQRSRPICGLQVLGNLKNEGESWGDGWVYDPRRGKTFDADIWLKAPNILAVRGYMGIRILSETKIWTRAGKNVPRCTGPGHN